MKRGTHKGMNLPLGFWVCISLTQGRRILIDCGKRSKWMKSWVIQWFVLPLGS